MNITRHTVVIEWSAVDGESPHLLIERTREDAVRALVADIAAMNDALYGGLARIVDNRDWLVANPVPDARGCDLAVLRKWLEELHEDNNCLWWTIEEHEIELAPAEVQDQTALNQIADLLNEPGRWSYDHLDDIAAILRRTGRKVGVES